MACLAAVAVPQSLAATFTVNLTGDDSDGICDAISCTLREAITTANGNVGVDQIFFDLPLGNTTISPNSGLPALAGQLTIDGTTQAGYASGARVVVDGSSAGAGNNGFDVNSAGNVIKGLVINGFSNRNVWITAPGNTLTASFVGTDTSGTVAVGVPAFASVTVQGGSGNTIGGPTAADGNVIAGRLTIFLAAASGTIVRNNKIGVDATGTVALGTAALIVDQAPNAAILDNVVSSIEVQNASGTDLRRNRIGTNAAGTAALAGAPTANGIQLLAAPSTTIGGAGGDGNVISGKAGDGIRIQGSTGVVVKGNWIGTSLGGFASIPNSGDGILTIGVGTPPSATIGGIAAGQGNTIANNLGAGVAVFASAPTGIVIRGNAIYANGGLGIDLGSDGRTANDTAGTPDTDTGPNGFQNFPVVTNALQSGGNVSVDITLQSTPLATFTLDVYVGSSTCDARRWIGTTDATTNAAGLVQMTGVTYVSDAGAPQAVLATATGPEGTSELSACTPISGSGGSLAGSRAAPAASVDLTADGTADWAVWGFSDAGAQCTTDGSCSTTLAPDVRKSGGGSISSLVNVNPGPAIPLRGLGFVAPQPFAFSWSNGSPTASAAGAQTGLQHNGGAPTNASTLGTGFSFTVPADTTSRTLKVWVALNRAGGQFSATLSDGSSASFADSYDVGLLDFVGAVYTLTYRAASAGQTLTVAWVENVDSCPGFRCDNVSIHAVALSGGGGPSLVVTNTNDSGGGSLRQAITDANAQAGLDTITFAIPGIGPHVINALSNLPDTGDIVVDGTTQPGYSGTPVVEVRGPAGISQAFFGAGNAVTVKGLSITNWGTGVALLGSGSVQDSWLGVEPGGALRPNISVGVLLEGTGATVVRSRIAGGKCGVLVTASTNGACGITPGNVRAGSGNTIGGSASAGNTIYGFAIAGVNVSFAGTGNKIQGNVIGLDPTGSPSGSKNGVFVGGSLGTVVGADAGPGDLYNEAYPTFGNVVAGIGGVEGIYGISVVGASNGTKITFNSVGTDRPGTATTLGINGAGIRVTAPGVQIGPGNKVAYNSGAGVNVATGAGNRIVANSIHDNGGLGISLVNANNNLAAPTLTGATVDGSLTTFSGSVDVPAPGTYFVELFSNASCDDSGFGEGKTYLNFGSVSTGAPGFASFSIGVTGLSPVGVYTATLTSAATNDTSAFSSCFVTTPPLVTGLTISGPATANAGASEVPLAGIPPFALVVPQASGTQAAPVNQSPVNQSPVNQLPVNQLPVNQSPVNQSPVNQLPVNQSPVNQSGLGPDFKSLAIAPGPLGDTALSTIPLLRTGGWDALLTGTPLAGTPLQSVTLRQVFSLTTLPAALQPGATDPLRFADIDFSNSPLGSLPAMTLALGQLPLSGIPLSPSGPSLGDWCALFSGPPLNCTAGTQLAGTSLLSAALEGAPVNQSPVNQSPVNQSLIDALKTAQAPVNQLPVNQLPVNQLPVNQLPVNQSRILSFPVNQLPVNQSPVNQLSLNAILAANAPVNQSPVNQLPVNQLPVNQLNAIIDCTKVTCATATLGQAFAAGAVRAGLTLGDLRRALAPGDLPDTWTIADLQAFPDGFIVGDLLASLPQPNDLTLADVLALALFANNPESFAFETLNIFDTSLSLYASPLEPSPYVVAFTLTPNGGPTGVPTSVDVSVTLPPTFSFAPGTATRIGGAQTCGAVGVTLADPVLVRQPSRATKATWSVPGTVGSSYKLCFTARPGIILGPQAAALASAKPDEGAAVTATAPAPIAVMDGTETTGETGNNTVGTASTLTTDKLYLSYLTAATDVDYYRFPVPAAGSRTMFHLSHLPADYDLVVYGQQQTALRPVAPSTPPLDGAPLTDTGSELTHATDALPSQTLDDLRLQALPLVGVSASRGTDPEDITVLSDGGGGSYTVQVTSYNGATSADPYMLRVTTEAPRAPATTPARSVTGGTNGTALGALPTGFNTLFLVNQQRLESFYPGTGAELLTTLASTQASFQALGFPNAVLSVDAYSAVRAAYGAWDADPGNPDLANKVVAAINAVVDSARAQANGAGLKYLVIVGGDGVIPQGRLGDFTTAANETGYADTFSRSSDLYATLRAGQTLSDDPYGTLEPVPYLNRQLHIPRLAVGRLVETPAEISATLTRFGAFSGRLDPSTSLTTGYDFMKDGATAINAPFATRFGTGATTLISDGWVKSALVGGFLPAGGSPSITSLNGHADHYEFAPPSAQPPYFTSGDLPLGPTSIPAASAGPLVNRLVFSMGCHSGLSVGDAIVTASTYDWPQAYARNGVGAYLGNTGYGYGDSLVVAYSEQLDAIFARKIAVGSTVGNALTAAKQEYFGGLGVFGVYDEKAMAEFTLYGLPMWSVTLPGGGLAPLSTEAAPAAPSGGSQLLSVQAATAVPTSTAVVTDSATGLQAEAFTLDGITNTEQPAPPLGRYWSGPDGVQVTHFRPLQPKAFVDVTGTAGHGALITELRQLADTPGVDPVFARPIVDAQSTEPELAFGDVAFPSRLQALRTFRQDGALKQRVVLMTGQFFTGSSPGSNGAGVQRLYTRIGARVLRSSSNDFVPSAFTRIDATGVGTTAAFAVDVTDAGGGTVKRVLVALRIGADTTWTFADLGQVGSSARWSGGVPLQTANTPFEYFVQAVDAAGNVAVSTNKGFYFAAATPAPSTGSVTVAPATIPPSSGWFAGPISVVANGPAGVALQVSVDGGPFTTVTPGSGPSIDGEGIHVVVARGSNGGTATTVIAIDNAPPSIIIGAPTAGASYTLGSTTPADFTCSDAGSGVASCTATVAVGTPFSTATLGTKTFTVNATDNIGGVGHTATRSVTYNVIWPFILFASSRTGNGDIYVADTRGGTPVQLTSGNAIDGEPAWSPDHKKIAFTSTRDGNVEIYVMNADGSNVTRLTTQSSIDSSPGWSPDGTRIAFSSNRTSGNWDIFAMNAINGGNVSRLTTNAAADTFPAWSSNGAKIAFSSARTGGGDIYWMYAGGASQTRLTTSSSVDTEPAWFGSTIAFSTNRDGLLNFEIYTMPAAGGSQTRRTTDSRPDTSPAWSPDGTKIAFASNRPGGVNFDVFTMNADGSGQAPLAANPALDLFPDW